MFIQIAQKELFEQEFNSKIRDTFDDKLSAYNWDKSWERHIIDNVYTLSADNIAYALSPYSKSVNCWSPPVLKALESEYVDRLLLGEG